MQLLFNLLCTMDCIQVYVFYKQIVHTCCNLFSSMLLCTCNCFYSSLPQGEFPPVPLSPTSEGSVAPHNHIGVRSEGGEVLTSPRKKPRKQNMLVIQSIVSHYIVYIIVAWQLKV